MNYTNEKMTALYANAKQVPIANTHLAFKREVAPGVNETICSRDLAACMHPQLRGPAPRPYSGFDLQGEKTTPGFQSSGRIVSRWPGRTLEIRHQKKSVSRSDSALGALAAWPRLRPPPEAAHPGRGTRSAAPPASHPAP